MIRRHRANGVVSEARYSPCGAYRYALTRTWDSEGERLLFVLLNPSTASERVNDPTVERCQRRARALGAGAFRVVNLFGFRATDPRALYRAADPVGPGNDAALRAGARWAGRILCGWGTHGALQGRGVTVETLLRRTGRPLWHLGTTQAGAPRHPLYIAYAQAPEPWAAAVAGAGKSA